MKALRLFFSKSGIHKKLPTAVSTGKRQEKGIIQEETDEQKEGRHYYWSY